MEEDKARVTKVVDDLIEIVGPIFRCKKCDEVIADSSKDTKAGAANALYLHLKLTHNLIGNLLGR